ncbi:MAG: hypothetical protein FJ119_01315 [Deltaproteobacteria bacterium]|nr:hypothetical protein [Deltaproteobacteria bacterium]
MQEGRPKILYLDVCTLCRPFDDQNIMRTRLETDAYYLILQAVQNGQYQMVASPVHREEINAIADMQERHELLALLKKYSKEAKGDIRKMKARAEHLHAQTFGVADAAHIAFAEATADYFISCDDRLLKKCRRHGVEVVAVSPVEFVSSEDVL